MTEKKKINGQFGTRVSVGAWGILSIFSYSQVLLIRVLAKSRVPRVKFSTFKKTRDMWEWAYICVANANKM